MTRTQWLMCRYNIININKDPKYLKSNQHRYIIGLLPMCYLFHIHSFDDFDFFSLVFVSMTKKIYLRFSTTIMLYRHFSIFNYKIIKMFHWNGLAFRIWISKSFILFYCIFLSLFFLKFDLECIIITLISIFKLYWIFIRISVFQKATPDIPWNWFFSFPFFCHQ